MEESVSFSAFYLLPCGSPELAAMLPSLCFSLPLIPLLQICGTVPS